MGHPFFCCDAVLDTYSRQIAVFSGCAREMMPVSWEIVDGAGVHLRDVPAAHHREAVEGVEGVAEAVLADVLLIGGKVLFIRNSI